MVLASDLANVRVRGASSVSWRNNELERNLGLARRARRHVRPRQANGR